MGSLSKSKGRSQSSSSMSQSIWDAQSPFLNDLYQRGYQAMNQFQPNQEVYGNAMNAWQQQLQPQMNPYLDQMTAQYTQALGQLDNQTGAAAAASGVFGGGRQGVEQHLNQQNIGNQIGNFLGNQYQADQARAMSAIGMAPQMIGIDPMRQQQGALQNYAGIIGAPTRLAYSSSSGKSKNSSLGFGLAAK